jgi:hypothetical protein
MRKGAAGPTIAGLLAIVLAVLATAPASSDAATPLGSNLLANPGAESGAAGAGSGNPPPGWMVSGDLTQIAYGTAGGYPTQSSPGPADRGAAFFGGGNTATASATQTIAIGDLASQIDAGTIAYDMSAWLGGYATQDDSATLVATFLGTGGATLATSQLGPVLAADRGNVTGFVQRASSGTVAAGTRSIRVVLSASRSAGTSDDGYADVLSLALRGTGAAGANLVVDGDAEAATCTTSGYDAMTTPGWSVTAGGPNAVCVANTGGFPGASAPGVQPGAAYFTGGTHGDAGLRQIVGVSGIAAAIDAGTATYDLSGWLGGYGSQNDRAGLVATFQNAAGGALGSAQLAAVTATDRGNVTKLLRRAASGALPAGTRSIRIDLTFTHTVGGTTDGYADGISLTTTPAAAAAALTAPPSSVPAYDHVFFVEMENQNYSATSNTVDGGAGIIGNSQAPYLNALADANALLTNYSAITHNSDPNYVAVAAGDTFGHSAGSGAPASNCITTCTFNAPSLGDRLEAVGKTWKQYTEGANGDCDTGSHGYYLPDEAPFYYFPRMKSDLAYCRAHWNPLTRMTTDLQSASTTPAFVWFAADDCNDMEACGIAAGDHWLSSTVPQILNSPAWTAQRSLLVITFDEDGNNLPGGFGAGQTNQVATIVVGSQATVKTGLRSAVRYDHYSSARTIEQALGLAPLTSNDRYAVPFNDVFR